jgi:hypothetical protein
LPKVDPDERDVVITDTLGGPQKTAQYGFVENRDYVTHEVVGRFKRPAATFEISF